MKKQKKSKKSSYYFSIIVGIVYMVLFIINTQKTQAAFMYSLNIIKKIIPVLLLIIIFMWLLKYVPKKMIKKYIGKKSGLKGWMISVITGMLSHGPIYVWYPLLQDLRKKGMSSGMVATFLYCRAIKIPLLPMMIAYFGGVFTLILTLTMLAASILEGIIIQKVI